MEKLCGALNSKIFAGIFSRCIVVCRGAVKMKMEANMTQFTSMQIGEGDKVRLVEPTSRGREIFGRAVRSPEIEEILENARKRAQRLAA